MTTLATDSAAARPGRRWQFSLRTLLLLVTLLSAIFAGTAWWVTLPLRTWRQFVARLEAGDREGANALCDPATLRIVSSDENDDAIRAEFNAHPERLLIGCDMLRGMVSDIGPIPPRTWSEILKGRLRGGMVGYFVPFGRLEVRCNKVIFDRDNWSNDP